MQRASALVAAYLVLTVPSYHCLTPVRFDSACSMLRWMLRSCWHGNELCGMLLIYSSL